MHVCGIYVAFVLHIVLRCVAFVLLIIFVLYCCIVLYLCLCLLLAVARKLSAS
jgi:hypothetical protein